MHPLEKLAEEYQQLKLGISEDSVEKYKNIVFGGSQIVGTGELNDTFSLSSKDRFQEMKLRCGSVSVITLDSRRDFENFLRIMVYKCSNVEIASTIGASILLGVNNWKKIRTHKEIYMEQGGVDWSTEFRNFTAKKENYQDSLIILSTGSYSNLNSSDTLYSYEDWMRISYDIRKYHELTHFISRKKYPDAKNAVLDEVIADSVGIYMAIGSYPITLAQRILGITDEGKYDGGRLEEYVSDETMPEEVVDKANETIHLVAETIKRIGDEAKDLETLVDNIVLSVYAMK